MPVDARAALPRTSGELVVDGLEGSVRIRRDRHGVPHVSASTVTDLFFGQGFLAAQDRLWHLEHDRRRYRGTAAELLGERAVIADVFARRADLGRAAVAGYRALDDEARAMCDAHAAGINAGIASLGALPVELQALDAEPAPFDPWDAIGTFLVRHVTFATWQTKLWRARVVDRLGVEAMAVLDGGDLDSDPPSEVIVRGSVVESAASDAVAAAAADALCGLDAALDATAAIPHLGAAGGGSNSWVLAGSRTASGAPLLAGDPHRAFEVPNVYQQLHLEGPGIDVAGFTFPGVPGVVHFAHAGEVAWGVTNGMVDYQDLFVERVRPSSGGGWEWESADGWEPCEARTETVSVRDGEAVTVEVLRTGHGPAVIGDPGSGVVVALASTGLEAPGGSLGAILPSCRARTVDDVLAAHERWVEPVNSLLVADRSGTIAYRTVGHVPQRHPANRWLPVPGWTGEHDWTVVLPVASMPAVRDPEDGLLVTANNRPIAAPASTPLAASWPRPYRARRLRQLLAALDRPATVEDCAAVHLDSWSEPGSELARRFVEAAGPAAGRRVVSLRGAGSSNDVTRALVAEFEAWDGRMVRGSVGAGVLAACRAALVRRLATHPRFAPLADNPFAAEEPPATARPLELHLARALDVLLEAGAEVLGEPWDALLRAALEDAAAELAQRGDRSAWTWGSRHAHLPLHALRRVEPSIDELVRRLRLPVDGDADAVCATAAYPGLSDAAFTGPCTRYVWDLADRSASRWVVPLGASGHPASFHVADQQGPWLAGELLPLCLEPDPDDDVLELRPA